MALRERLFAVGADVLFADGSLRLGFVRGGFQFDPVPTEWKVGDAEAATTVVWVVPVDTELTGANLIEGDDVLQFVPFVDEDGHPDHVRLLKNMRFAYDLSVGLL